VLRKGAKAFLGIHQKITHNDGVTGSNPLLATNKINDLGRFLAAFFMPEIK